MKKPASPPARRRDLLPAAAPLHRIGLAKGMGRAGVMAFWRLIAKRRWIILASALISVVIAAVSTWRAAPEYRAVARVRIDPELPDPGALERRAGTEPVAAPSREQLRTQIAVLTSGTLARRVVARLKLDRNPEFMKAMPERAEAGREWFRAPRPGTGTAQEASLADRRTAQAVDFLLSKLSASPIPGSRLVDVRFAAPSPALAAGVANAAADEYIRMNTEPGHMANPAASDFIAAQVTDIEARVEKSREELARYSQGYNLGELEEKRNAAAQKLADLDAALIAAESTRMRKEALWEAVRRAPPGEFPENLRDQAIKDLEASLGDLRREEEKPRATFGPAWPESIELGKRIAEAEKQLADRQEKVRRSAEQDYQVALRQVALLRDALAAQKPGSVRRGREAALRSDMLKRQADSDRQVYEGVLRRVQEAGARAGLRPGNIRIVDPAVVPTERHRPRPVLNLSLALALGLLAGIGLALVTERLDRGLGISLDVRGTRCGGSRPRRRAAA